jgi:hypothetical protein
MLNQGVAVVGILAVGSRLFITYNNAGRTWSQVTF